MSAPAPRLWGWAAYLLVAAGAVAGPVALVLAVLTLILVVRRAYRMAVVGALLAGGACVVWVELLSSASG